MAGGGVVVVGAGGGEGGVLGPDTRVAATWPRNDQTAQWIIDNRWGSIAWRTVDWLMLSFVVFHAFMGMRTIVGDYTRGGVRTLLTMGLYLSAFVLFALGTVVLVTLPFPTQH